MSARRLWGEGDFLSSRVSSVNWLDNNANLVCISAAQVPDFVGHLFSLFISSPSNY